MSAVIKPVELTEEEKQASIEREQKRVQSLDEIGLILDGLKEEAVVWRAEFEMDWSHDYAQYNAASRALGQTKRDGAPAQTTPDAEYRQTSDNITRSKVIITAARLGDMLFPTNEANWALDITPKPDIPDDQVPPPPPTTITNEDGTQSQQEMQHTPETLLEGKREVARKRMNSMQDEIKDQFLESHYDEAGRSAIFDGCLYGSGVLFGPSLKVKRRHTYKGRGAGYQPRMVQSAKPSVEYVDLWSFFPQPARSIDECEHAFRLHILPKRGLRQLVHQPGFDSRQIQRLLSMTPAHGALVAAAVERGSIRPDAQVVLADRYSVWQYRGPMPKDAFAAFVTGLVMQGDIEPGDYEAVLKMLEEDQLAEIDCEVWFSQGIVIKMAMSTLGPGELGYYVFNYEKNPQSLFGRGVAFLCRDDQRATNQLWHAMMLNSMMSAGPQIGVKKDALVAQPGDGRASTLSADKPRVWALNSDVKDIKEALSVFVVPNVTDKIMAMYERAKANADEHTMTPLIAQGEPTSAVPTSSGMAMLMNAANVVMRRLAKAWDDEITVPLVTSFYDWNMANNEDDSIRGDYCVVPRGASHLLIKDVMAQHLQLATQLFSTNPMLAPYMKASTFARKNIEMMDFSAAEMLYTDDQVAENARQQGEKPDPEVMKAQAAAQMAEATRARAEAEARATEARIALERESLQLSHQSKMADIAARERIQQMQLRVSEMTVVQKMAEMGSNERIAFQKIIADLTKDGAKIDLGQYQADTRAAIDAEKIASQEHLQAEEIKAEKSKPKVKVQ